MVNIQLEVCLLNQAVVTLIKNFIVKDHPKATKKQNKVIKFKTNAKSEDEKDNSRQVGSCYQMNALWGVRKYLCYCLC